MSGFTALKIHVYGIVQGVGFRPFVARLARKCAIAGSVCNKGPFVEIIAEGNADAVELFSQHLISDAPDRAVILKMEKQKQSPVGFDSFRIIRSEKTRGDIFVSPDIATCPKCEKELFDPENRRYLHPFINCTACGPRVTILDGMPYDRARTSMKAFPMCGPCRDEYTNPETRRYHAQPVCCNDCGPELYLLQGSSVTGTEALLYTRDVIRRGGIAAVKGIGGFHLCADASNELAAARLRALKKRPFKPFAVMMRDIETVRRNCEILPEQEKILTGPNKPILILRKKPAEDGRLSVCKGAAPDNPYLGVMLPYAPVQMLLFSYPDGKEMPDALIMTSGNAKDTPICMNDTEAALFLTPFVDVILSNNREIRLRADDSVMQWLEGEPYMIRRSRGYAPLPVMATEKETNVRHGSILGIGGELKNTFCLGKDTLFYLSPYIGNLVDTRGTEALKNAVVRMEELLEIQPEAVVCDLHPGYSSSAAAREIAEQRGIPLHKIQHHYAHVLSCMAENDYHDEVIGVAFDGTGYGTDETIWGGEFLIAGRSAFRRAGSITPFMQAGGDLAPREGWRIAAALLGDAEDGRELAVRLGVCSEAEYDLIQSMARHKINTLPSSSAGRVFDAVSAVLGFRRCSTSEGEASMVLQYAAEAYCQQICSHEECSQQTEHSEEGPETEPHQQYGIRMLPQELTEIDSDDGMFRLPVKETVRHLAEQRLAGEDPDRLAYEFHEFMARLILRGAQLCREQTGLRTVALSGGVMQNTLLMSMTVTLLEKSGFRVLRHHMIPSNDGGISLGQAYYLGSDYIEMYR